MQVPVPVIRMIFNKEYYQINKTPKLEKKKKIKRIQIPWMLGYLKCKETQSREKEKTEQKQKPF